MSAVYNVERYLEEFIASVDGQLLAADEFEVIAVDDGSTDGSLARLERWAAQHPDRVRVLTKENGGQGSARNLGLEHVRGDWVTFPDPDDVLEPDYLSQVAKMLDEHPEVVLAGGYRLRLDEATGELTDTHPLRAHHAGGDRVRNLAVDGDYFYGNAPVAFYRRDVIERLGLRFDPVVRPRFEDGHFSSRYLLAFDDPAVAFVRSARYHYRRRSGSTLQQATGNTDVFTTVLRHGYLDLLDRCADRPGGPPEWLQNQILYDLSWHFSSQESAGSLDQTVPASVAEDFHALMAEIVAKMDRDVIARCTVRGFKPVWRDLLLHGYEAGPWHSPEVVIREVDPDSRLVKLTYRFTGELPHEEFFTGGLPVEPLHAKVQDLLYQRRVLMRERIVWLSSTASVRVRLDHRVVGLSAREPAPPPLTVRRGALDNIGAARPRSPLVPDPEEDLAPDDQALLRRARSRSIRRRYADAWVLLDRIHNADDSAEHLFRHLREHRPEINAWFVVEKDTPDWRRLHKDGHGRRVVAYGSDRWKMLMLHARHLISSHADAVIVGPPELRGFGAPWWRFTFLQHGVIKDDLSTWLNHRKTHVFVTSTVQEHASIAGDHTPYLVTTKETVLTGLPRFDRLREAGRQIAPAERDLILLVPTWRRWLVQDLEAGSQRREASVSFLGSDFVQQWTALMGSDRLRELCAGQGLQLAFLPHPNLQAALPSLDLPAHVQPLSYEGNDVQRFFARAALMVTDYSSIAFNSAYMDRPVIYFQFDADRVLGGDHMGRAGYFDYARDGFGPVVAEAGDVVTEASRILTAGRDPLSPYAERIDATFPQRDGRCCERVTEAIIASTRPVSRKQAREPEPTPMMPVRPEAT